MNRLLEPIQFIGRAARLRQICQFARIEYKRLSYSRPKPLTGSSQAGWQALPRHTVIVSDPQQHHRKKRVEHAADRYLPTG
jgi:hypothetical protein